MAHRKINLILAVIISVLIFASCKKETKFEAQQETTVSNKETVDKVNAWLDTQKTKVTGDRPQRIQRLKQNLIFSKLRFEELFDGEKLIVVPVNSDFQTENNKGKNPINCLLMILDKTGKIRKGNIVQYIPTNRGQVQEYTVGFFNKYYHLRTQDINGILTFLSVSDDLFEECKYENGWMTSHSVVETKAKDGGSDGKASKIAIECYDVWWVTYYPDGSTTWEYLYSFCNGGEQPCKGSINTNGRTYRVGCGGGGGEEEEETQVAIQRDWIKASSVYGFWHVISTESFTGIKKASETGGGHFTGVTHLSSYIVGQDYSWSPSGCTTSFTNSSATIYLGGIVTYVPQGWINYISSTPSTVFSFQQVFP